MKYILLTGGLGYIGSHVALELLKRGRVPVIIDDLSNSEHFILNKLEEISGTKIPFEEGDVSEHTFLSQVFEKYDFESVIHFAAKKAVGESIQRPLEYYENNVYGLINLLKVIAEFSISKFIFSSSCTVYGTPEFLPVTERTPFGDTPSPYGKTKQMCEQILMDVSLICDFEVISLRYFNPVGAHESALIGELPRGIPANLVPFILQTAVGIRDKLLVYGDDYETHDGFAVRDYIHVVDLAVAHVKAMEAKQKEGFSAFNIGTGKGFSVFEVIKTFEQVSGVALKYEIVSRRSGDVPEIYGDSTRAYNELNWKASRGLHEMLADAWRWQQELSN